MAVETRKAISILALGIGSIMALWAWVSWARVEGAMQERQPLKHSPALIMLSGTVISIAVIAAIAFI